MLSTNDATIPEKANETSLSASLYVEQRRRLRSMQDGGSRHDVQRDVRRGLEALEAVAVAASGLSSDGTSSAGNLPPSASVNILKRYLRANSAHAVLGYGDRRASGRGIAALSSAAGSRRWARKAPSFECVSPTSSNMSEAEAVGNCSVASSAHSQGSDEMQELVQIDAPDALSDMPQRLDSIRTPSNLCGSGPRLRSVSGCSPPSPTSHSRSRRGLQLKRAASVAEDNAGSFHSKGRGWWTKSEKDKGDKMNLEALKAKNDSLLARVQELEKDLHQSKAQLARTEESFSEVTRQAAVRVS